jgi:hypothetical protein
MQTITLNEDGLALLQRHADWWQRKGSLCTVVQGTPLGDLWLPLADGTVATEDLDLAPEMLDIDRLAGPPLEAGALEFEGDRFRTAAPYMRVPWVEAILGTPIRATIQGGSMRTMAFVDSWEEWEGSPTHRDDGWFDLLKRFTELLVQRSGGRYAVVQTLMRGPVDLAEAVLGPERLCLSMYDHPRSLCSFLAEVTDTFIEILREQLARIPSVAGGTVTPFGIWAPGTVVRTQCDATAFLSAAHYAEWFLPYDVRICETVDYSIIHLHSCSLHTVDALLAVERPHAVQVTLEAEPSGPPLGEMVPIFRKILGVKPLLLEGKLSAEEQSWLRDRLPSDGLAITARRAEW